MSRARGGQDALARASTSEHEIEVRLMTEDGTSRPGSSEQPAATSSGQVIGDGWSLGEIDT
jgi:hypothetical protein